MSSMPSIDVGVPGIEKPSKRLNSTTEITIGIVLGLITGGMWKAWQWNDKADRDEYYRRLKKAQSKAGMASLD